MNHQLRYPPQLRSLVRWLPIAELLLALSFSATTAQVVPARPIADIPAPIHDAPKPVTFPADDAPHGVPIEWWYYTGHLFTEPGDRYGFEFVVFKAETGPVHGYASHFAITDNQRAKFRYNQRLALGNQGALEGASSRFDLRVGGWSMSGSDGQDNLQASMDGYAISLQLESLKPPVLHDGDGYIDYGSGEAAYYYSRTRIAVEGVLTVDGQLNQVTGLAWFDHQWGRLQHL